MIQHKMLISLTHQSSFSVVTEEWKGKRTKLESAPIVVRSAGPPMGDNEETNSF